MASSVLDFLAAIDSLDVSPTFLGFTKPMNLAISQKATPSDDVLFQRVGDEAVLLSLTSEQYFGLDPVGTRIWSLLSQDTSLQAAFENLCLEYEVEPERLEADLLAFVDQLAQAGLVKVA